jgi:hypothetical protein
VTPLLQQILLLCGNPHAAARYCVLQTVKFPALNDEYTRYAHFFMELERSEVIGC